MYIQLDCFRETSSEKDGVPVRIDIQFRRHKRLQSRPKLCAGLLRCVSRGKTGLNINPHPYIRQRVGLLLQNIFTDADTYCRFLQSPLSNIDLSEAESMTEHCISTLTCLLCGLETFLREGNRHTRAMRVVKGIHGLHVYATEYWTDYLLQYVSNNPHPGDPKVLELATRLAQKLSDITDIAALSALGPKAQFLDPRLNSLEGNSLIRSHVEASLRARSLKRLESSLVHEIRCAPVSANDTAEAHASSAENPASNIDNITVNDGVSVVLSSYQETVRFLLKQDHYPGISAEDLASFKRQFQSSAFTCRLSFCPRATIGFASDDLRQQHEIGHTKLSLCTIPTCKYPPFISLQALNNHIEKHHSHKLVRRSIRRVGHISNQPQGRDLDADPDPGNPPTPDISHKSSKHTEFLSTHVPNISNLKDHPLDRNAMPMSKRKRTHDIANGTDLALSSSVSSPSDSTMGVVDGNWLEIEDLSKHQLTTESRKCEIPGCEAKLSEDQIESHYWNEHHADTMAQCAMSGCRMTFGSNENLQLHYELAHTVCLPTTGPPIPGAYDVTQETSS